MAAGGAGQQFYLLSSAHGRPIPRGALLGRSGPDVMLVIEMQAPLVRGPQAPGTPGSPAPGGWRPQTHGNTEMFT